MEQLLLHLWGDYITQTNWMANEKTKRLEVAFLHAVVYSLPFFFFLDISLIAYFIIMVSHALIDHFRLARYVVFAKNWITEPKLTWEDCKGTGYPSQTPPWLAVWLLIIADNILHVTINFLAIKYL